MQSSVWDQQIEIARTRMPLQFAETIAKAKYPFVQAITDVISPKNSFMDGKILLTGDALAGFRPHTVASTPQAAYDALLLADLVSDKITHDEYVKETMQFARLIQDRGVKIGDSVPNFDRKSIPSGRRPSDWIPGRMIVSNPADGFTVRHQQIPTKLY